MTSPDSVLGSTVIVSPWKNFPSYSTFNFFKGASVILNSIVCVLYPCKDTSILTWPISFNVSWLPFKVIKLSPSVTVIFEPLRALFDSSFTTTVRKLGLVVFRLPK